MLHTTKRVRNCISVAYAVSLDSPCAWKLILSLLQPFHAKIEDEEDLIAEEQQSSIKSMSDLKNAIGIDSFIKVGKEGGLLCYCGDVECVIEMKLYRYSRQK